MDEFPINIGEMLLDFGSRTPNWRVEYVLKGNFCVVVFGAFLSFLDRKFFNIVIDDVLNVKTHRAFNRLAQGRCAHSPPWSEPTGCALHAHTEFRKTGPIRRYSGWPKGSSILRLKDTGRIVSDRDTGWRCRVDVNIDLKFETPAMHLLYSCPMLDKALHSVIDEFAQGVPRLIVEMP